MAEQPSIRWPAAFAPVRSAIHIVNELRMDRPPEAVWVRLIRAADWPAWYVNSADVRIEDGGRDLYLGARFTWRTFGVSLVSTVVEFQPCERIAWTATGLALSCCHAWLIVPTQPGGSLVRTEETQNGIVARLGRVVFPRRMEHWHQRWLEGLAH